MTPEEKTKLIEKIKTLGFTPFPYTNESEFENNPARIEPILKFDPEEWLTINQCEVIADKSDRTIYRWQSDAPLINFTIATDTGDRHYIRKADLFKFMQDKLNQQVIYVEKPPMTPMSALKTEGMTDRVSRFVSADLSDSHTRQTPPIEITTEVKEKLSTLTNLPDQLGKKIEESLNNVLKTHTAELDQKISRIDSFLAKQIEDKTAASKTAATLPGLIKRSTVLTVIVMLFVITGIVIFTVHKTEKIKTEYNQRLKDTQDSLGLQVSNLKNDLDQTKALLDERTSLLLDVADSSGKIREKILNKKTQVEKQ